MTPAEPSIRSAVLSAMRRTHSGGLPERYSQPYDATFRDRARSAVGPGMRILDVGGGRLPTVLPPDRPPGCHYVGLDLSEGELHKAGPGAYDETAAADVSHWVPHFEESFDLALSWQVLEHVKPLDVAIENLRRYLKPGGRLLAQMSGKFSAFGLINQALPPKAGMWALTHLVGKSPDEVFPAYYHRCWHDSLARILEPWSSWEIVDLHVGAMPYWRFSTLLRTLYVGYEEWAYRRERRNLASYYVIDAVR
jgi:SAM-dependent methyltransferase